MSLQKIRMAQLVKFGGGYRLSVQLVRGKQMTAKKRSTPAIWNDPDDAPQLTAEFFQSADLYKGDKVQARGRPKAAFTKEPVKLRLDADVLAALRASVCCDKCA